MSKKPGAPSLSNGTLSLRFMQRGATQRVSTTAAKVSDEAEWDIGPAARAALGVSSGTGPGSTHGSPVIHVTRDESYISFMFNHDEPGPTVQEDAKADSSAGPLEPGRRRIFRQGTEVTYETSSKVEHQASEEPEASDDRGNKPIGPLKGGKKQQPTSISGPSSKSTNNVNPPRPPTLGTRRHRLEGFFKPANGSSSGFVKPAGIASATINTSVKRTREEDLTATNESHHSETRRRRS